MALVSNCCGAQTTVEGSTEGTNFYVCVKCGNPCDAMTPERFALTSGNVWCRDKLTKEQTRILVDAMAELNGIDMANDPSNALYLEPGHITYAEVIASEGLPIALLLEQFIARHGFHE